MHTNYVDARSLMADAKFYEAYSRYNEDLGRYETWEESVDRVMSMHREFYKDKMNDQLDLLINEATSAYKEKLVLGSQRALQFGGDQLLKNHARQYNCASTYIDRPRAFAETFWMLLAGCGVGFSVQKHHIAKLPKIAERKKAAKTFVVEDSVEGWADSLDVLLSSFFVGGGSRPEYEGRRVFFDTSLIRKKGALISGGFKAPGPEPLRKALDLVEHLIMGIILSGGDTLRPIDAYDILMYVADAVLSGGVRRSATICLFSYDDNEMMNAKTGNWFIENPQRGRSNNSVMVLRETATPEMFKDIFRRTKEFGEPGFIFTDSLEFTFNPCVEISKLPVDETTGESGFQVCNLSEINGAAIDSLEKLKRACRAASILGTLQAGYSNLKYLTEASRRIIEREALLGVSITGWMASPDVLFDDDNLRYGANVVKEVNKEVAEIIGINQAARTTCVKPSGNASVLLMGPSGIHGEPSPRYLRFVQMNKEQEVGQLIRQVNPYMVEESVWSSGGTDYSIAFPVIAAPTSIFTNQLKGVNLLDRVKQVQSTWIEEGTNIDLCVDPRLRHNVSNTVTVANDNWDEVGDYLFDNMKHFAGVSFLADSGDKDYFQAPFTSVLTPEEIVETYGTGGIFGAGLVVDALKVFPNLWNAISVANDPSNQCQEDLDNQGEWIRKFHKFTKNYFEGDSRRAEYCLKDLYIAHKWEKIQQTFKPVDFTNELKERKYTEIDTMGAIACSGGACEIVF